MRRYSLVIIITILTLAGTSLAAPTWEAVTSGTTRELTGVFANSESTVIAVGSDRVILRTTDFGRNWTERITTNDNRDLKAVHFPSASVGYASGHNSSNNWAYILKSIDGGLSWSENLNGSSDVTIVYDIFFLNDSTGWACGSPAATNAPVIYTTDGGTSWTGVGAGPSKPSVSTYYDVFFVNSTTGWVVGGSGAGGKIFKTTDGGTNWSSQAYEDPKAADIFNDVYFINATTGWIAGNVHDFGPGESRAMVLVTTDGGATWVAVNSGSVGQMKDLDFLDADNGWGCAQGNAAEVYKTTDGGSGWGQEYHNAISTGLDSIDIVDPYNGWTVGRSGVILRMNDDPTITSISPSTVTQGTTSAVVIQGTNFLTGLATTSASFSLSGITVNSLTRDSDAQLTLMISVSTTGATGVGNFTLTNPDTGSVTETGAFSVNPFGVTPPTVTTVSPTAGGQGATMDVTISGSGFLSTPTQPTITFGNSGVTVNSTSTMTASSITCNISIAPTASATSRTITITNNDGGIGSKSNAFTINNGPSISSMVAVPHAAASGYTGATATYYVTGNYFQSGATAAFSPADITVNSLTVNDPEHITLALTITGSASPTAHSLTITNPDFGAGSLANALSVSSQSTNAALDLDKTVAGPNPWNPLTGPVTLQFYLTKATLIKLTLFTLNGEKVNEMIVSGVAGYNKVAWNGKIFSGHAGAGNINHTVPNGIFLVNIIDMNQNKTLGKIKVMVQRYL